MYNIDEVVKMITQFMGQLAMQQLENRLQRQNPQMYQMLQKARQNGTKPEELFKEVTNGYTPEQMNELFTRAKQMGIPDEIINRVRY